MIEIVFDEGIAANLRVIMRQCKREPEKIITYMNEKGQASDVALNDILCLQLYLDKGPINCCLDSNCRKKFIEEIYYEHYSYIDNLNRFKKIKRLANEKNAFRIWVDNLPSSLLGLYCVCNELKNCNVNIYVMDINVCVGGYGNIFSWAQVEAEIMLGLLKEAKKLTRYELNECINSWNKNINSNWNLRSYINGSIVRIHDNFFDDIILGVFCENKITTINKIIQNLSEHYLACIDDYYIIYRIRYLVKKNKLSIIKNNSNAYLTLVQKNF